MGWEQLGERKGYGYQDEFRLQKNGQARIRILTDELPPEFHYHTRQTDEGTTLKFLCIGSRNGCRFCEANNAEQYVNVTPDKRPYPWRSTFAGPVYVYDTGEVKLLIGWKIWMDDVKAVGKTHSTVINRDFSYQRQDVGRWPSYKLVSYDPTPFAIDLSKLRIPDPAGYKAWLEGNISQVRPPELGVVHGAPSVMTQPGSLLPAQPAPVAQPGSLLPAQPAPVMGGGAPIVTPGSLLPTGGAPVAPPQPVAPPASDDLTAAKNEFGLTIGKKFDPVLADEVVKKHGKGVPFNNMDAASIRAAAAEYSAEIAKRA
jgi:hypothetical protein